MHAKQIRSHCSVGASPCRGSCLLSTRQSHPAQRRRTPQYSSNTASRQRLGLHRGNTPPHSWSSPPPHEGRTAEAAFSKQQGGSLTQALTRRRVVCHTARVVPALLDGRSDGSDQTAAAMSSPLQGTTACPYIHPCDWLTTPCSPRTTLLAR